MRFKFETIITLKQTFPKIYKPKISRKHPVLATFNPKVAGIYPISSNSQSKARLRYKFVNFNPKVAR